MLAAIAPPLQLKFLGYIIKPAEAALTIWEVDDDADGSVNWEEFREMFYRVRDDQSGYEPRKLFNVVEVRTSSLSALPANGWPIAGSLCPFGLVTLLARPISLALSLARSFHSPEASAVPGCHSLTP